MSQRRPAPTNTCPPTNLRLSKPSDDDDRLDLAYEVSQPSTVYEEPYRIQTPGYPDGMKFELYRAASEVELCEPEESTCSAQYTEMVHFCGADETPAADNCAPSPTTTPAQSVAFDGLDGGYFYQARGTGCVHKSATDDTLVCGAWSGLSGAVQVPATPPPTPIPVEPVEPPPLTIRADVDPETCLTGGTVTIDWEVSGARGEVSVSVAGYFVPRSRETGRFVNVPCMDEAGVQSETVIAVDDGPPLRGAIRHSSLHGQRSLRRRLPPPQCSQYVHLVARRLRVHHSVHAPQCSKRRCVWDMALGGVNFELGEVLPDQ